MNTILHGDAIFDEVLVDKEIGVEAKDAEAKLIDVVAEPDAKIVILLIQTVLEDIIVADGKNWRHTSVFSTIVTCLGKSRSLYINIGSALNGMS